MRSVLSRVRPCRAVVPTVGLRSFVSLVRNESVTGSLVYRVGAVAPVDQLVRYMSADLPPHAVLTMPALSPTMDVGTITEWSVEEGAELSAGDVIAQVQTDKAAVDFEIQEDGYMAKFLVDVGHECPVGERVAIMVEDSGDVAAFASITSADLGVDPAAAAPAPAAAPEPAAAPAPAPAPAPAAAPSGAPSAAATPSGGPVPATPLARTLARESGYDLSGIPGTGPGGRVIAADVREFVPAAAAAETTSTSPSGDYSDVTVSDVARDWAERLMQAKREVPHYYETIELNLDNLLALRERLNSKLKGQTVNVYDFLVKAAALSMKSVPEVNSSWMGDRVRQYNYVDVCVAVGTESGVVAPVVRGVEGLGLLGVSEQVTAMADAASEGALGPADYEGGTFTISNLGMYGVKSFSPIITAPQSASLAIGAAARVVVPNEDPDSDAVFAQSTRMNVTLSSDHRVIDGAVAAQWLSVFKAYIEDPETMLL